MGLLQYTLAFVFIGLFSIGIMGFAIDFASDNNSFVDISDDPDIITFDNNLKGNVSAFRTDAQGTYESIIDSSTDEAGFTTKTGGSFSITPPKLVTSTRNVLGIGYQKIFGQEPKFAIFMTTFLAMVGFFFSLYFFKAWIGRIPD